MEHFVTLFDSGFLPQGLALHQSLQRHAGRHTLWILCMDEQAFSTLEKLALPDTRLIALASVETEALLQVKAGRSRGEYCWTLTPFTPDFVFALDENVQRVTYIDADIWLRKSPAPIFQEFTTSGKSVLITDHAYAPEYDQSANSGQFCVQFMTFVREKSRPVLQWWQERCLEWCFARYEEGRFGDQKYLDDWPERFADYVHVLADKELALAPWNATRFPYGGAIFWHFHGLRLLQEKGGGYQAEIGTYQLPACTVEFIYKPYLGELRHAIEAIQSSGLAVKPQKTRKLRERLRFWLRDRYQGQRRLLPVI